MKRTRVQCQKRRTQPDQVFHMEAHGERKETRRKERKQSGRRAGRKYVFEIVGVFHFRTG